MIDDDGHQDLYQELWTELFDPDVCDSDDEDLVCPSLQSIQELTRLQHFVYSFLEVIEALEGKGVGCTPLNQTSPFLRDGICKLVTDMDPTHQYYIVYTTQDVEPIFRRPSLSPLDNPFRDPSRNPSSNDATLSVSVVHGYGYHATDDVSTTKLHQLLVEACDPYFFVEWKEDDEHSMTLVFKE